MRQDDHLVAPRVQSWDQAHKYESTDVCHVTRNEDTYRRKSDCHIVTVVKGKVHTLLVPSLKVRPFRH